MTIKRQVPPGFSEGHLCGQPCRLTASLKCHVLFSCNIQKIRNTPPQFMSSFSSGFHRHLLGPFYTDSAPQTIQVKLKNQVPPTQTLSPLSSFISAESLLYDISDKTLDFLSFKFLKCLVCFAPGSTMYNWPLANMHCVEAQEKHCTRSIHPP